MPVAPSSWTARPDALVDKTVLVTGAAEGIGRAASLAYAAHGAEVLLMSRNEARLESLYDEIIAAGGREPAILQWIWPRRLTMTLLHWQAR